MKTYYAWTNYDGGWHFEGSVIGHDFKDACNRGFKQDLHYDPDKNLFAYAGKVYEGVSLAEYRLRLSEISPLP